MLGPKVVARAPAMALMVVAVVLNKQTEAQSGERLARVARTRFGPRCPGSSLHHGAAQEQEPRAERRGRKHQAPPWDPTPATGRHGLGSR